MDISLLVDMLMEFPDAKDKGEYSGGRSMAARIFDPLQVFSKDKPATEGTGSS